MVHIPDMTSKQVLWILLVTVIKHLNGDKSYGGENFPKRYLELDSDKPVESDINTYVIGMMKIMDNMMENANHTDFNQVMGAYLATVILKRTLRDYNFKLKANQKELLKAYIRDADSIVSHFVYQHKGKGWSDTLFRISRVLRDDTGHVHAISDYRKSALNKWILSERHINEYIPSFDNLTLPKEKYVEKVNAIDNYHIKYNDSDYCLSMLSENIDPIDVTKLRPCKRNSICRERMFTSPSFAYTLSHRLLNNVMYMFNRRCYIYSPEMDSEHMDMLCAGMYRETVYIARRGYFARDLFLEHIGLCGQLGYEEFNRRHWFRKVLSWIDYYGCIHENHNFEINRTRLIVQGTDDPADKKEKWKKLNKLLLNNCHYHQMALAMVVLANGVRHVVHFMDNPKGIKQV